MQHRDFMNLRLQCLVLQWHNPLYQWQTWDMYMVWYTLYAKKQVNIHDNDHKCQRFYGYRGEKILSGNYKCKNSNYVILMYTQQPPAQNRKQSQESTNEDKSHSKSLVIPGTTLKVRSTRVVAIPRHCKGWWRMSCIMLLQDAA